MFLYLQEDEYIYTEEKAKVVDESIPLSRVVEKNCRLPTSEFVI